MIRSVIVVAALVACSGDWAEPIKLKGFYAAMTADEFIANAESLGAVSIKDYRAIEFGREEVSADFSECRIPISTPSYDYCVDYFEGSALTVGGANILSASWKVENTNRQVSLKPVDAHRVTLSKAIRLKFGEPDESETQHRGDAEWTEYYWIQDTENRMEMLGLGGTVTLSVDLSKPADTDDF